MVVCPPVVVIVVSAVVDVGFETTGRLEAVVADLVVLVEIVTGTLEFAYKEVNILPDSDVSVETAE